MSNVNTDCKSWHLFFKPKGFNWLEPISKNQITKIQNYKKGLLIVSFAILIGFFVASLLSIVSFDFALTVVLIPVGSIIYLTSSDYALGFQKVTIHQIEHKLSKFTTDKSVHDLVLDIISNQDGILLQGQLNEATILNMRKKSAHKKENWGLKD